MKEELDKYNWLTLTSMDGATYLLVGALKCYVVKELLLLFILLTLNVMQSLAFVFSLTIKFLSPIKSMTTYKSQIYNIKSNKGEITLIK